MLRCYAAAMLQQCRRMATPLRFYACRYQRYYAPFHATPHAAYAVDAMIFAADTPPLPR